MIRTSLCAAALALLVVAAPTIAQDDSTAEEPTEAPSDEETEDGVIRKRRNLTAGRRWIPESIQAVAAAHTNVTVTPIGTTFGGRPIEVATITRPDAEDAQWIALVIAGLDGARAPSERDLASSVARWLAENTAEFPAGVAFQVIAEGNPDAFAAATPRAGNGRPVDDDIDGDEDEDGPDDVNGDGRIDWIAIPDPTGDFSLGDIAEPAEPEQADPSAGKPRTHRIVREGRDDDDDGAWNEDGPGGVNVARNFNWGFKEHVRPHGMWPSSEPETRAIMDHLLADERIAIVYEIGAAETLVKGAKNSDAWPKLPDDDEALVAGLRELHEVREFENPELTYTAHAPASGSLAGTVWHQLGRIWVGRAPLGTSGEGWVDGAPPWPTRHVMRWTPLEDADMPAGTLLGVLEPGPDHRERSPGYETRLIGEFLVAVAADRAQLAWTETHAEGSDGVLRLRTKLVNTGRLPTHTERGAERKGRRPLNVRVVLPDGARLLAGVPHKQIERLAGGAASDELAWVIAGNAGDTVRIEVTGPDVGRLVHEEVLP